ncbi:MAG: TOBE domain-containing protein [Enterobacter hormaechei]
MSIYHVRLKRADAQRPVTERTPVSQGQPTWGDEVSLCWDADSCVVLTV